MLRRLGILLFATALLAAPFASGAIAKDSAGAKPVAVTTAADAAKEKLHPKLLKALESGSTKNLTVFAIVSGSPTAAKQYLTNVRVANSGGVAILVGTIRTQALPKLAGAKGVVSVGPIDFSKTGRPLGVPDPQLNTRPSTATLNQVLAGLYAHEVPYSEAPPLAGSNFDELKDLALLDARTHNFAEAWAAGYTGSGVIVGVMDGGTDFGHPDLIGTWQTWSGQTGARAGWNGWPMAFDPYGTLQWLSAPSQISSGLSWYVETSPKTCKDWAGKSAQSACAVKFSTKTGPSRNFNLPAGTQQHTYQFPAGVTKSGHVMLGSHPDDYLLSLFGERPGFLVTDAHTAGVYDTVYVDLDNDHKFGDEKPVNQASPASYRDMDGDGYTDLSGGLLYYISDGATAIPGGLDAFGILDTSYGPGELVAWTGDYDPAIGGHGTLTASNVVGQGVINGKAPTFDDVPGGTYPGAVIGGAPDARLAPYGDIYFSFDFSTQFGYYLATRRGVDITSNSYGNSAVDNDGWDAASQEADIIHSNRRTTPLFSTGNGAPGFGTVAPPSPIAGIAVGASTQFGGTGWDSIKSASQIVDDDVMVWSNRGFGATGTAGVDVVADGAFSAGDLTLNAVLNGQNAWETWGGTSRSTPVAVGATALVYQSYRANVGAIPTNFFRTAKDILKSSAQDLGYNATIQGAGSIDAGRAVEAAAGSAASVSPNEWRVGDYRGTEYPVFSNIIEPGGSDSQSFTISGGSGPWSVSDRVVMRTDVDTFDWTSANISQESASNFNAPDYLFDLTSEVNAHPDADLMVIRANYPRAEFDSHPLNYDEDQAWRLLTYNWTDVNHDGNLWTDGNGNGVVNHANLATSSNIDSFPDINFGASEMDQGEYVRFMYHRAGSNALMSFVRDPADRMADGLFWGLQHSTKNGAIPVTHFQLEISFYENVDWDWVSATPTGGGFDATINVPADAPYGMYEGAIVAENGDQTLVVPVAVAVAASVELDADGNVSGAIQLGGSDVAEAQEDFLYNNGAVFGANDWTWRAESGDWRFFFVDVPSEPADGNLFLARTTWDGTAPYTDIDTLILGRSENGCQLFCGVFGAPYIIDTVGGSPNTHLGSGVWTFDTATGGAEDFVAAPVQEGLHNIALHQVSWQGDDFTTPFEVTLGGASVSPAAVDITTAADSGSFDVTFTASVDLDGLMAEGFGLSQPQSFTEPTQQDNPNDPSSASIKHDMTIDHASTATIALDVGNEDVDLFVVYDANHDGLFTNSEIVASSTGPSGADEFIQMVRPADGDYQVWAQGWSVSGTPNVTLGIDVIQGNDLAISGIPAGAIAAGTPVTLTIDFSKSMTVGQSYFGELLLGPPTAPSALHVPIKITKS
jgi:hypothetical protein